MQFICQRHPDLYHRDVFQDMGYSCWDQVLLPVPKSIGFSLPSFLSSWAWGRPGCVKDAQTTFVNHIPSFTCLCLLLNCTDHISLPPFPLKLCLPFPCLENFSSKQPNSGFIWKWYQLQWSLGQGREEAESPVEVDGF